MSFYLFDLSQYSDAMAALMLVSLIVLVVIIVAAWFVAMKLFIKAAKMKGHYLYGGTAPLWFVGIFATPILVGIYVAGLPDLSAEQASNSSQQNPYYDWSMQSSYDWSMQPPYDPYSNVGYQQPYSVPYSLPPMESYPTMYSSPSSYSYYPTQPPQRPSSRYGRGMW